jgi:hypothetical protein
MARIFRNQAVNDWSVSVSPSFVGSCRYWLAANSIWATVVVASCVIVAARWPIDRSWPLVALFIVFSVGLLWRGLSKTKLSLRMALILILGAASTVLLLWPCLTKGAFVSVTGDTFLYTAFGQYLTDHHRGLAFGLSPIDQYAVGLSETRFCTASVLGFLSVLFRSTTAAALPFYIFIVLANIFSGFVLLSRKFGCNRLFSLAAGLLSVVGGWTPNALNIGGLDNLLFLSLFPFLIVRLEFYRFGSKSWSASLGLATLAAAVFYAYPEGLAVAGIIFLPFFLGSLRSGMHRRGKAWRRYALSACIILLFIAPYLRVFVDSLLEHVGTGFSRGAAGIFSGLLSSRLLPAMFGFGPEYPWIMYSPHDLILPLLMLTLICLGWVSWIKRRKSLIVAALILMALAIWQGSLLQYDYGLYKILFVGSLIWIPSLFRGATALANFVPRPRRRAAVAIGAIALLSGTLAQRMEQQEKIPWREVIPVKWYSELANLRHQVGNRPVFLACDRGFNPEYNDFDQEWAVYFLRKINLKLPEYLGYFTTSEPLMRRAKSVDQPADFILINEPVKGAVWSNERFSLFELSDQAKVIGVQGNGAELVNGRPFVWLGNSPKRFLIASKIAQTANFMAWEYLTGPSVPENQHRQIRISIAGTVRQVEVSGDLSVEVSLKPGLNILEISCQGPSAALKQSSEAPGALPVGLWNYRISSQ